MDNIEIERVFDRKIGEMSDKQRLERLEHLEKETKEENQNLKKELFELKHFVENAEPCPSCNKLILSNSKTCKHCDTEFEHEHQH